MAWMAREGGGADGWMDGCSLVPLAAFQINRVGPGGSTVRQTVVARAANKG